MISRVVETVIRQSPNELALYNRSHALSGSVSKSLKSSIFFGKKIRSGIHPVRLNKSTPLKMIGRDYDIQSLLDQVESWKDEKMDEEPYLLDPGKS